MGGDEGGDIESKTRISYSRQVVAGVFLRAHCLAPLTAEYNWGSCMLAPKLGDSESRCLLVCRGLVCPLGLRWHRRYKADSLVRP